MTTRYTTVKTMLGGVPDVNRRAILRVEDDGSTVEVRTFNQDMKPWTSEMEAGLLKALAELRGQSGK